MIKAKMPSFIDPEDLAAAIVQKPLDHANKDVVVIDVRTRMEYGEGHIKGAKHMPSDFWYDTSFVDNVVESTMGIKRVVFHCAYSQQRGPKCARIFRERIQVAAATACSSASTMDHGSSDAPTDTPSM